MKTWLFTCGVALSLVTASVAVASPAHAACTVYLEEAGFTLTEGARGYLTVHRDQCQAGDYEIRWSPNPTWDFDVTVLPSGATVQVDAVNDGPLPETTDDLVVEVRQGGQVVDTATVTIPGAMGPYPAIVTACDVKGRELVLVVDLRVWWGQATQDIEYSYELIDGTAKAGQDYTPVVGGTGVIKLGQPAGHIPIEIYADGLIEGDEYFLLRLTSVSGAVVADDIAVITIEANAT